MPTNAEIEANIARGIARRKAAQAATSRPAPAAVQPQQGNPVRALARAVGLKGFEADKPAATADDSASTDPAYIRELAARIGLKGFAK